MMAGLRTLGTRVNEEGFEREMRDRQSERGVDNGTESETETRERNRDREKRDRQIETA